MVQKDAFYKRVPLLSEEVIPPNVGVRSILPLKFPVLRIETVHFRLSIRVGDFT